MMNRVKSLIVMIVLSSGFMLSQEIKDLAQAVKQNNVTAAERFIREGADVNQQMVVYKTSLLHIAIEERNEKMVRLLAQSGADLNIQDCAHETPVMFAASRKDEKIVDILLTYGAALTVVPGENTALHLAAQEINNMDVISCLLWYADRHGELDKILCANSLGMYPSDMARQTQNYEVIELLENMSLINKAISAYKAPEFRERLARSPLPLVNRLHARQIGYKF